MDADRFDRVARVLAGPSSRRAVLRGLVGGVAGVWSGARATATAAQATRRPNGVACSRATECASFRCVDGVCCDTACTGQCEACNLPGNAGTCLPVTGAPIGNRPACSGTGACQATCDGETRTACAAYPGFDAVCDAPVCAGGWQTTYGCGGDGTCHPTPTACGLFACNPDETGCLTSCTTNEDCVNPAFCANGVCQGDKGLGEACTSAGECLSGFCVNDVCCAEACAGGCDVCGADGSCGERDCGAQSGTCHAGVCNPDSGECETVQVDDRTPCEGGFCCGGACVDLATDAAHCGECGAACDPGVACARGTCGACETCGDTGTCCPVGEACVDVESTGVTLNVCCAEETVACPTLDQVDGLTATCCGADEGCTTFTIAFPEGAAELGICCPPDQNACRLLDPSADNFGMTCCASDETCVTTTIGIPPLGTAEVGVCCPPGRTTCLVTNSDERATAFECCAPGETCSSVTVANIDFEVGCCPPDVSPCVIGRIQDPESLQLTCCGVGEVCAAVPIGFLDTNSACCPADDVCTILGSTLCCEEGTDCAVLGTDPGFLGCCPESQLCFFSSVGANVCCPEGTSCNQATEVCE